MTQSQVLVIAGPTASGKSALALALAEKLKGDIINGDSLQLYQDLPVLTAQPRAEEKAHVPHYLYAILQAHEHFTAWQWAEMTVEVIHRTYARGRVPIIVGGTGFYLRTLLEGLTPIPEIPRELLQETDAMLEVHGSAYLYELLAAADPLSAQHLSPHDRQRVSRAWSVWRATGQSFKEWQALPRQKVDDSLCFYKVLLMPERGWLYERINKRFWMMLEQGALEEVQEFIKRPDYRSSPVFHALGASELARYLRQEISLDMAIEAAQKISRHYGKRQCTWFRHQFHPHRIFTSREDAEHDLVGEVGLRP